MRIFLTFVKCDLVIRWAYSAKLTLFPDAVVVSLYVVEYGGPGFARVAPYVLVDEFFLNGGVE